MITKNENKQNQMEVVILENLVPKDHILRKIDNVMDFSFIYPLVEDMYSNVGRPSIDPVLLIKLAFMDKLFGYNSMRRTCRELEVNLAMRWFLGLSIEDKTPHFSDFSKTYTRKFSKEIEIKDDNNNVIAKKNIFEIIFEEIIKQAMERNYIYVGHVYMDSTHIKANANKKKVSKQEVEEVSKNYQAQLNKEIDDECQRLGMNKPKDIEFKKKEVKQSNIDKEAGVFFKGEHETQVAYLAQTVCDSNGFILNVGINPANMHDSSTFSDVYQKTIKEYGVGGEKGIRAIGLDAAYKTPAIAKEIIDSGVTPLLPYTRPKGKKYNEENPVKYGKKDFRYDGEANVFKGANECILAARGMDRKNGYIIYRSKKSECDKCQSRNVCLSKSANTKTMVKHIWQGYLDEVNLIRLTGYWQQYYKGRSQTIERVFADAKEKHGLRFTRKKGKSKVLDDTRIVFATMNLKKMAIWAWEAA